MTVDWSVAGAGASPVTADDFAGGVLPTGTLTIPGGATGATLTVPVAGDGSPESDESFVVTLANARAAVAITWASAGGTILNDDASAAPLAVDWRLPVTAA